MIATAKDLRVKTKALLNAIERGEEIIVTHRGKACARIIPAGKPKARKKSLRKNPLFGIWHDHKGVKNVAAYMDNIRRGRQ